MCTPQKHLVIQAISCNGTTTLFGFIASVEMMHPNLAHITGSASGKLTVNEDSKSSKQVLGYGIYYGSRLQALKENLLPWSSRKAGSLSSDLDCLL